MCNEVEHITGLKKSSVPTNGHGGAIYSRKLDNRFYFSFSEILRLRFAVSSAIISAIIVQPLMLR